MALETLLTNQEESNPELFARHMNEPARSAWYRNESGDPQRVTECGLWIGRARYSRPQHLGWTATRSSDSIRCGRRHHARHHPGYTPLKHHLLLSGSPMH